MLEEALESKCAYKLVEEVQKECGEATTMVKVLFDAMKRSETVTTGILKQMSSLEEAVEDKANAASLERMKTKFNSVDSQISSVEKSLEEKASLMQSSMMGIQTHLSALEQTLGGKAENVQMQQLKVSLSDTNNRLASVTSSLQSKAESDQLRWISELTSGIESNMHDLKEIVHDQARSIDETNRILEGARDSIATLDAQVEKGQVRHLESLLAEVRRQISGIDNQIRERATLTQMQQLDSRVNHIEAQARDLESSLLEKANASQIQPLRSALSATESQIIDLEQCLQEKASVGQMHQIKTLLTGLETKVCGINTAVQDKASLGQMQQLKTQYCEIQSYMAGVEASVQEKLTSAHLQQILANEIAAFRDQVCGLVQCVKEKADEKQVEQLRNAVNNMDSRISSVDMSVSEKANMVELQNHSDLIMTIVQKMRSMEKGLRECMASVEGLDQAIVAVDARAGNIEKVVIDHGVVKLQRTLQTPGIPERRSYSPHIAFAE
jgi:predicted  nucleic acid-binding Zn-ribbon protein